MMTAPIPEAAVEAAARVLFSQSHLGWADWSSVPSEFRDENMRNARAALTAARPHMEAEALSAWADYFDHYDDGPGRDPLTASKAAQLLLRRPQPFGIAAATIAERTNDEPA